MIRFALSFPSWSTWRPCRSLMVFVLAFVAASAAPKAAAQDLTPIGDIQGKSGASPLVDKTVTAEGVVTGFFPAAAFDGFFLQATGAGDGDPATSDGIWVFDGNRDFETKIGDVVRATGLVKEYYNQTEIQLDKATVVGTAPLPAPLPITNLATAPTATDAYLEPFEGMRVAAPPLFVVGATNGYGEVFGVPVDSGVKRVFRQDVEGRLLDLAFPNGWFKATYADRVSGAVGPLAYRYDRWTLAVDKDTMPQHFTGDHTVPYAKPSAPEELTIASYNVENFFDTVRDPGKNDAEWTTTPEKYAVEVARRARSVGDYLAAPDIVGFAEVEHEQQLADMAKTTYLAKYHYGARLIEGYDERGIDVGFMWKQDKVRLISAESKQTCTSLQTAEPNVACTQANGASGWLLYSRPPMVATFEVLDTGARFTLIMNHFKSKRGGDDTTTPTRVEMAKHNLRLVAEEKTRSPGTPVFVMGDLNDFEDSEPIKILTGSGALVDLHSQVPHDENYSFIFSGVSQILDYILVEPSFAPNLTQFRPQHINADFPNPAPEDLTLDSPRTTDHDPLLIRFPISALPRPAPRIYLPYALNNALVGDVTVVPPTPQPDSTSTPAGSTPAPEPTRTATAPPRPTDFPPPTATPGGALPRRMPLKIADLFYDGVAGRNEPDEYLEFKNISAAEVELTGWRVVSVQGNQVYRFKDGAKIAADQTCRLYTDENHPESCGFNWANTQGGIWANAGDKAEIYDANGVLIDYRCYGNREGECP